MLIKLYAKVKNEVNIFFSFFLRINEVNILAGVAGLEVNALSYDYTASIEASFSFRITNLYI
jgi:hypothetical protein